MSIFNGLKPEAVWNYFEEICKIPRPSNKEEKIVSYLLNFGKKNNLETSRDSAGNVLIQKPATKGKEKKKTVVLQCHVDMVCEKNNNVEHNFEKDPIQPYIDGDWVKAKNTTLGADDGIGMAAAMAVLTATNIEHGPIECLFTVGEEIGLIGAFGLQEGFLKGSVLINLDSEDEGELFIGCAGGIDTIANFDYELKPVPDKSVAFKITVHGLLGGHSGDEINKGLGNSNKIINRLLWNADIKFGIRLATIDGGNLRNAIPREANAVITVSENNKIKFSNYFSEYVSSVKKELEFVEPNFKMTCEVVQLPRFVINKKTQFNLFCALYACPHGVLAMSHSIPGLVETSTNLASVKYIADNKIQVVTSQRSSINSAKFDVASMVESAFSLAGAEVTHTDGYPGWTPNVKSEILKITKNSYTKLFGNEPQVKAIHAGLECGLFLKKYPEMDMVSFGPTIKGAHSPDERLEIQTVSKFWDLLVDVLQNTPDKK